MKQTDKQNIYKFDIYAAIIAHTRTIETSVFAVHTTTTGLYVSARVTVLNGKYVVISAHLTSSARPTLITY